jgi:hypothetical protein
MGKYECEIGRVAGLIAKLQNPDSMSILSALDPPFVAQFLQHAFLTHVFTIAHAPESYGVHEGCSSFEKGDKFKVETINT